MPYITIHYPLEKANSENYLDWPKNFPPNIHFTQSDDDPAHNVIYFILYFSLIFIKMAFLTCPTFSFKDLITKGLSIGLDFINSSIFLFIFLSLTNGQIDSELNNQKMFSLVTISFLWLEIFGANKKSLTILSVICALICLMLDNPSLWQWVVDEYFPDLPEQSTVL